MSIEAMRLALEALTCIESPMHVREINKVGEAMGALRQAIEQAEQDHTYGYAKGLAEAIFKQHFASDEHYASGRIVWGVNDTVIGILTQIDNMVAGMVRKPEHAEQAQPVACIGTNGELMWIQKPAAIYSKPQPLYSSLSQRKPLTDDEIDALRQGVQNLNFVTLREFRVVARAIEAAHGIK